MRTQNTVEKWTIRRMPLETIEKLKEVREASRVPIPMLLAEAVDEWFDRLPEE